MTRREGGGKDEIVKVENWETEARVARQFKGKV